MNKDDKVLKWLNSIARKDSKVETGSLVIIFGPPCAGKTTVSKVISKQYNLQRLSFDMIWYRFYQNHEISNLSSRRKAVDTILKCVQYFIDQKQSVICEGLFLSNYRRLKVFEIKNMTKLHFIYLTANIDILKLRLYQRIKSNLNSEGDPRDNLSINMLETLYSKSTPPKNSDLIVDSSNSTLSKTIENVTKILNLDIPINDWKQYLEK